MNTFKAYFPPNDPNATVLRGRAMPVVVAGNANDGGDWPKPGESEFVNPELGAAAE